MSEDEIKALFEDRKNGMGLQKAAKKYSVGVQTIRRLEKEAGMEIAIPTNRPLRIDDVEQHFKESREFFEELRQQLSTALENLNSIQKQLKSMETTLDEEAILDDDEESILDDEEESILEEDEKIEWQLATGGLIGLGGLLIAAGTLYFTWRAEEKAGVRYVEVPFRETFKKPGVRDME